MRGFVRSGKMNDVWTLCTNCVFMELGDMGWGVFMVHGISTLVWDTKRDLVL